MFGRDHNLTQKFNFLLTIHNYVYLYTQVYTTKIQKSEFKTMKKTGMLLGLPMGVIILPLNMNFILKQMWESLLHIVLNLSCGLLNSMIPLKDFY